MSPNRVLSIDVFRGLTIFTMVFVNDLAGVGDLPGWMKHAAADADTMTFVDVVFPAFLFIVGMSIPFAVQSRMAKGASNWELWKHILIRTIGLLILGVYMVNSEEMNGEASLISKSLWDILFYSSVILLWNQYPKTESKDRRYLFTGLQIVGVIILLILPFLFRKGPPEALTGMTPSWWGILGLIGWAYLYAMIVFLAFRRNLYAMVGMLGMFIVAAMGLKNAELELPGLLAWLPGQAGNLVQASLCLSGIILSQFLIKKQENDAVWLTIRRMLVFSLLLLAAGFFLRPFYGISKIYATPTWALYSAAICAMLFPLVYWLVDIKGQTKWAGFLQPAGQNPLLTYILPYIFIAAFGYSFWPDALSSGMPGLLRSVVFSLFILGLAALLTRVGIRLRL
jgi:predicted acyltransferase